MKEKGITYRKSDIVEAVSFLNSMNISGINNARCISAIANILDKGIESEINTDKEGVENNGSNEKNA